MIRLFSNIYNQTFIGLIVFTVLIRLPGLFFPYINTNIPVSVNYLQSFFNILNQFSILGFLISTCIVFFTAILFNNLCNKHELIIFPSYLPAYFFIILNSLFIEQYYAGPVIFVNFFLISSLNSILNLYKSDNPYFSLFSASFLAGLSSLLNISYIAFFAIVLIGINIFRPFNLRENIATLIGFIMPLYIGTMINFLINGSFLPFHIFFPDYGNYQNQDWVFNSVIPLLAIISILGIVRLYQNFYRNTVKQKRSIQLMLIIFIATLILVFTGKQNTKQEFSFLAIPLAFFYTYYFSNSKINVFKEFLNLLLLVIVVFFIIVNN